VEPESGQSGVLETQCDCQSGQSCAEVFAAGLEPLNVARKVDRGQSHDRADSRYGSAGWQEFAPPGFFGQGPDTLSPFAPTSTYFARADGSPIQMIAFCAPDAPRPCLDRDKLELELGADGETYFQTRPPHTVFTLSNEVNHSGTWSAVKDTPDGFSENVTGARLYARAYRVFAEAIRSRDPRFRVAPSPLVQSAIDFPFDDYFQLFIDYYRDETGELPPIDLLLLHAYPLNPLRQDIYPRYVSTDIPWSSMTNGQRTLTEVADQIAFYHQVAGGAYQSVPLVLHEWGEIYTCASKACDGLCVVPASNTESVIETNRTVLEWMRSGAAEASGLVALINFGVGTTNGVASWVVGFDSPYSLKNDYSQSLVTDPLTGAVCSMSQCRAESSPACALSAPDPSNSQCQLVTGPGRDWPVYSNYLWLYATTVGNSSSTATWSNLGRCWLKTARGESCDWLPDAPAIAPCAQGG
jgi:hypothetical protein